MKRQDKLLYLCWLMYTATHLGRNGYAANLSPIAAHFGVNNATAGLVSTFFFFAYGCGQLLHGSLCKYYPKRSLTAAILLLCGALNLALFFEPPFALYKYIWLCNGLALAALWPSVMMILGDARNAGDASRTSRVMSTPIAVGTFATYGLSALFNRLGNYRLYFLVTSALLFGTAILWFVAYPRLTAHGAPEAVAKADAKRGSAKGVAMLLFLFGLSICAGNLIKDGLNTWVPKILHDRYATSDSFSILLTLALPLCALAALWLMPALEKLCKNDLKLTGILFAAMTACIGVLTLSAQSAKVTTPLIPLVCLGIVYGITTVTNTVATTKMPLEMRDVLNVGLISGVMNACAYVGSTFSAYTFGFVADRGGWNAVFTLILAISAVGTVIVLASSHKKANT